MTDRMDVQDIIKNSDFVKQAGGDWEGVYKMVAGLLSTPEWRMMRSHNTLFLLHLQGEGTAGVTVFDADTAENFPKSVAECLRACKHAEINRLIFNAKGRYIQQMIRRMGYKVVETPLYQDERGVTTYQGDVYV